MKLRPRRTDFGRRLTVREVVSRDDPRFVFYPPMSPEGGRIYYDEATQKVMFEPPRGFYGLGLGYLLER